MKKHVLIVLAHPESGADHIFREMSNLANEISVYEQTAL